MPFIIPARPPNPWLTTFVDYMNHRREVEAWEAGQPKESGAALSASGAAGGAASGAAIGTMILPGIGTLIGAGIGAGTGAVVGKYTNPRMHPGEGPYAQPGNIAQDNAAIMRGIMATAGQVASGFKQAKDIKDRGKWVDEYLNYVFGDQFPLDTGGGTAQQRLAALDAFVGEIPQEHCQDVSDYYQQRIAQSPDMLGGYSPPQPLGMRPMDGARGGRMPPMPVGGAGPMRQPTPGMAPAANIPPAYTQQANAIFQQTEAAGMTREYSPRAKEAIKRLDDAVDAIITNPSWRPEEKARAIQMAAQTRAQIRKRASVAPKPPTWPQYAAQFGVPQNLEPYGLVALPHRQGGFEYERINRQDSIDPNNMTPAQRLQHFKSFRVVDEFGQEYMWDGNSYEKIDNQPKLTNAQLQLEFDRRTVERNGQLYQITDKGEFKPLDDSSDRETKIAAQRISTYARMMSALRVKDEYEEWTTPTHEEIVEAADKALDYAYGRPAGTAVRSNVLPQWRPTGAPQQPPIAPGAPSAPPSQPPIAPVAQPAPPQRRPPMTIEQARARAEAILAAIENRPPTPAEIEELKQLKAMGVK